MSQSASLVVAVAAAFLCARSAHGDPMRPIADLIDTKEPAWPDVQSWVRDAKVSTEILPVARGDGERPLPYLVVAHDAIGGVFAVNGGGLNGRPGNVFYFAPDSLAWEDL